MQSRNGAQEVFMFQPVLVSKEQARLALSISMRKLEGLIAANQIPVRRIGSRVLISHKALLRFAGEIPESAETVSVP